MVVDFSTSLELNSSKKFHCFPSTKRTFPCKQVWVSIVNIDAFTGSFKTRGLHVRLKKPLSLSSSSSASICCAVAIFALHQPRRPCPWTRRFHTATCYITQDPSSSQLEVDVGFDLPDIWAEPAHETWVGEWVFWIAYLLFRLDFLARLICDTPLEPLNK